MGAIDRGPEDAHRPPCETTDETDWPMVWSGSFRRGREWPSFLRSLAALIAAAVAVVLGHDGQLGQLGGGDADALEALGDDAVGGGPQADEQVHGRDLAAAVIGGAVEGLAQQADDVVGEELAVEGEEGLVFALVLV